MSSRPANQVSQSLDRATSLPPGLQRALSSPTIPALDALRAFAALLVVLYHAGVDRSPGGLGVLAFFVLSGFLITWLLLKEWDKYHNIAIGKFYLRRSLRIFPAFYVYWAIGIGLAWRAHRPIDWGRAWAAFFYFTNYWQAIFGHETWAMSHTWSLGVEEQFYLLWPFALLMLMRRGWSLSKALTGTILAVWAWRLFLALATSTNEGWFYEAFDTRMDHLAIGCLLAVTLKTGRAVAWTHRLTSQSWMPLLPLAGLAASAALEQKYGVDFRNMAGFIIDPLLVALLLVQWMTLAESPLWRWLQWPWLRYLGRISYSTYLYQQLVMYPVGHRLGHLPFFPRLLAQVLAVYAVASLSYWLVERPFLGLKDRWGKRKEVMA